MSNVDTGVGVVIVTYNSAGEIATCLNAAAAASRQPVQIVVVDNASQDRTALIIRESFPHVTLICNSENRYYAAASNQGIAAVYTHHLLLLNPDAVLPAGGIDALRQFLDAHPDAAAVAPRLIGPDGRRQRSVRELPGLDTLWYDLTGLSLLFPRSPTFGRWRMGYFDGGTVQMVDQPMASCLLVRRTVLDDVGVFDERYPMFFNDVDWCRRVRQSGYKIYYTPDVSVCHVGGAAINRRKVAMIWMGHYAYWAYLRRLYARSAMKHALVWLSVPPLFLAAVVRSAWWGAIRRVFIAGG